MIDLSLLLDRNVFVTGVLYTAVGSLLTRKVCLLSTKESLIWSLGGFIVMIKLADSLNLKMAMYTDTTTKRVFAHIRLAVVFSLLAYVSNKAASYLIKVPSDRFAMIAAPLMLIGGAVVSDALFGGEE